MAHAVLLTHPSDTPQRRLTRLSELRTLAEGKLTTASAQDAPAIEILVQEYALAGAMDMTVPLRDLAGDRTPRPPKSRRGRGGRPDGERGPRPEGERGPRQERGPRPEGTGAEGTAAEGTAAPAPESSAPAPEAPAAPAPVASAPEAPAPAPVSTPDPVGATPSE